MPSNYLVCLASVEMGTNFPSKGGQLEVSLKFNQHCAAQKNINALSPPMFTKAFFSKEYPYRDLHFSHLCVWVGVKGIRPFWLPWLYALFWLGLIVKSVAKERKKEKEVGSTLFGICGRERSCHEFGIIRSEIHGK